MKEFALEALLKPFAAILFCLVFGLPFVYTGFQTVQVIGAKDQQGVVSFDLNRKHFWGFWQVNEHIENAQHATLKTSLIHRSRPRRPRLVSGVFIRIMRWKPPALAGGGNALPPFWYVSTHHLQE